MCLNSLYNNREGFIKAAHRPLILSQIRKSVSLAVCWSPSGKMLIKKGVHAYGKTVNLFLPPCNASHASPRLRVNVGASLLTLIVSGDIELNLGPPKTKSEVRDVNYPRQICEQSVKCNQKGVACDSCELWYHTKCMGISDTMYYSFNNVSWHCNNCGKPNIHSSFFSSHTL